jgi:amidohydrolase
LFKPKIEILVNFLEEVKAQANVISEKLTNIRRHLHANPELSFNEKNTAGFISNTLSEWGIEHQTNVGGYGIVGLIKGKNPGKKVIALRADMDALPIAEKNQCSYTSKNPGVMHACGHDVHMTCLLGAALILKGMKDKFEGTVKLLFQHAEETVPGGAIQMIEAGALKNPTPTAIFGQHVFPELEAGKVGFKSGRYMASNDEITIFVRGRGGHAAMPERFDDTVLASAHILVALQQIVSRKANPQIPTVLSFGKIVTNGAMNILPEEVSLHGTFRTFSEEWRQKAYTLITETAEHTAKAHGCSCEVEIKTGYPFLVNDERVTEDARLAAIEYLGKENVVELPMRMTAEDFSRYSQLMPACFYRLGTANKKKGIVSNLHTPTFDVDETSIEPGAGLMAYIALKELSTE